MYTICYFSKVSEDITSEEIRQLLEASAVDNNIKDIRGIILHSFNNFFQVLEGKKEDIVPLFESKIKRDRRHHAIFEVVHKESNYPIFSNYSARFETIESSDQLQDVKKYLLEHSVRSSTSEKFARILRSFVILDD